MSNTRLVTSDPDHLSKPFATGVLARLLSRSVCTPCDDRGQRPRVSPGRLARCGWSNARDVTRLPLLLALDVRAGGSVATGTGEAR